MRRKPLIIIRLFAALATGAAFFAGANPALAQAPYPAKPVHIIVAFAPGGFADGIARMFGQKLGDRLGQTFVVENRGGAGGNIAARQVAAAGPDGYTLLAHTAAISINASLYRNPGFDLLADFAPVANTGSTPGLLAVHPSNPANNLQDLIRLYKGRRLTYSTAGVGTSSHLAADYLFKSLAGLDAVHVPYQGGAPAITAAVANQVDVISGSMPPVLPFVKQGRLKALSISSLKRAAALPDVATVTEAGFADFEERSWVGFFAPAKTDAEIVRKLNGEINQILALPDIRERLAGLGLEPSPGSPAEFTEYIKKEVAKWAKIVKATGVSAE